MAKQLSAALGRLFGHQIQPTGWGLVSTDLANILIHCPKQERHTKGVQSQQNTEHQEACKGWVVHYSKQLAPLVLRQVVVVQLRQKFKRKGT